MSTKILIGDCRETLKSLPDQSVHCVITSPPYWGLRSYKGDTGMIGLEPTWQEHLANLMQVFNEVWRVLRNDGTLWLNYGDAYRGSKSLNLKPKNLMQMPARLAIAMQEVGWILRSEIVWAKRHVMPESVRDRPTCSHEKIFLFSKKQKYYYDQNAVRQKPTGRKDTIKFTKNNNPDRYDVNRIYKKDANLGANMPNVWHFSPEHLKEAHFATFPTKLVEPCIKAGSPKPALILDPFGGSGTVSVVAEWLGRDSIICEINPEYAEIAKKRIEGESLPMFPTTIEVI